MPTLNKVNQGKTSHYQPKPLHVYYLCYFSTRRSCLMSRPSLRRSCSEEPTFAKAVLLGRADLRWVQPSGWSCSDEPTFSLADYVSLSTYALYHSLRGKEALLFTYEPNYYHMHVAALISPTQTTWIQHYFYFTSALL